MKKYISLILLCISIASFSQTEIETVNFINTKFNQHKLVASFGTTYQSIEILVIGKAKFINIKSTLERYPDEDITFTCTFDPKTVNSIIAKTAPNDKSKNIMISSEIKNIKVWDNTKSKSLNPTDFYSLILDCDDNELTRINKALIHLYKICGAKMQSDELFKN